MFPDDWSDNDLIWPTIQKLPPYRTSLATGTYSLVGGDNSAGLAEAIIAARIFDERWPYEVRPSDVAVPRPARSPLQTIGALGSPPPEPYYLPCFTEQQWTAVRKYIQGLWKDAQPAIDRTWAVMNRICGAAADGQLRAAARPEGDIATHDMDHRWWAAVKVQHPFGHCALLRTSPIDGKAANGKYGHIFVSREDLQLVIDQRDSSQVVPIARPGSEAGQSDNPYLQSLMSGMAQASVVSSEGGNVGVASLGDRLEGPETAPPALLRPATVPQERRLTVTLIEMFKADPNLRKLDAAAALGVDVRNRAFETRIWPNARKEAGLSALAPSGRKRKLKLLSEINASESTQ
jgi:hypothetical protein